MEAIIVEMHAPRFVKMPTISGTKETWVGITSDGHVGTCYGKPFKLNDSNAMYRNIRNVKSEGYTSEGYIGLMHSIMAELIDPHDYICLFVQHRHTHAMFFAYGPHGVRAC